ncbi:MAG: Crp/Fnr family transcriptional regulator [Chloroflexi bacterium]|nr:Crp/Fnr family transcriptional regulator [Chloroflexota bacterium]
MGTGAPHASRLLAALPQRELDEISRHLERVRLDAERPLTHAHGPIRRVYFPESAIVALSVTMADGRTAGVSIVGPEGMVGLGAMIGELGGMDAAVLVPGVAYAMSPERFRSAMRRSEGLRTVLRQYGMAMLVHLAQTVACNRLHSLDQRAARWLTLAHDRIGNSAFPLTQEAFADLLGVSRPAVSTVGARFARAGAAEFRRGTVHVLDTDRLEAASCECLEADREAFAASLAPVADPERGLHLVDRQRRLGVIRPEIRRAR